jgi:uncharacterized protein (TIGR04255 family)
VRPPVTEAIIHVVVNNEMSWESVGEVAKTIKKSYPHQETIEGVEVQMGGGNIKVSPVAKSYKLSSDNQTDIVNVSQNSLAVARLAPYEGWDILHNKFVTAWKSWKKVARTQLISRIGVRYINRIDIPKGEEAINLEDYLTFCPNTPNLSDFPITDYLIQVTQQINESWFATITSKTISSPLINKMSLLLDIEVFRDKNLPLKDEDLWTVIDETHTIKNTVFKSCITPKTEELFK